MTAVLPFNPLPRPPAAPPPGTAPADTALSFADLLDGAPPPPPPAPANDRPPNLSELATRDQFGAQFLPPPDGSPMPEVPVSPPQTDLLRGAADPAVPPVAHQFLSPLPKVVAVQSLEPAAPVAVAPPATPPDDLHSPLPPDDLHPYSPPDDLHLPPPPVAFATARPLPRQSDRTFGFNELGMFGQFGARFVAGQPMAGGSVAEQAVPLPATRTITNAAGETIAVLHLAQPQPQIKAILISNSAALPPPLAAPSTFEDDVAANRPVFAGTDIAREMPSELPMHLIARFVQSGFSVAPESEGGIEPPLASTGGGKFAARPEAAVDTPSPVNVLVANQDGTLSVVVRSTGESGQDFSRLRRLVEETAAEFGFEVGDFQLNGSGPESSFRIMTGGHRGNRAS